MAFKQINQLSQYMNEDSMLETYARGGKHFLLTKGGEIEIDSTTFNTLKTGKPQVEGKYILNFDKIQKAWKVQTDNGAATAIEAGDQLTKLYFDVTSNPDFSIFTEGTATVLVANAEDPSTTGYITVDDISDTVSINNCWIIKAYNEVVYSTAAYTSGGTSYKAGWQATSTNWNASKGEYTLSAESAMGTVSATEGWNGVWASSTAFPAYDCFFQFNNGEIVKTSADAYTLIAQNKYGFYSIGGTFYNQTKLVNAYVLSSNYYATLINGQVLSMTSAEFDLINDNFAEVVDDTIYFNANKFIKLADNNTGKFIEFKGGQRIAVDSTLFNTIKGDLTKIGDKYYYDTTQIVRGTSFGDAIDKVTVSEKSDGIEVAVVVSTYKEEVSGSTTPLVFVCDQISGSAFRTETAYGGIYFNTAQTLAEPSENKTYATFTSSGTSLPLAYALDTRKLSFNGTNVYDYATNTWDTTSLVSGYLSFGEGVTYTYTSGESTWNGLIISPTSFAEATYIWKIGTSPVELEQYGITVTGTLAENKTFKTTLVADTTNVVCDLHLANGMIIADVTDEVYDAITENFKALSGVKTNPAEIHKVFRVGTNPNYKYIAEIKTGYQIEITQAEYNAIAGIV